MVVCAPYRALKQPESVYDCAEIRRADLKRKLHPVLEETAPTWARPRQQQVLAAILSQQRLGDPLHKPVRTTMSCGFAASLCWMPPRAGVSNGAGCQPQGVMLNAGAGADGSQRLADPPAPPRQPRLCSYHPQGAHAMHQIRACGYYLFSSVRFFHPKWHFVFLLPTDSLSASPCFEKSSCYSQVLIVRYVTLGGIWLQTMHCNY